MAKKRDPQRRQNLTVQLARDTIRRAKLIASKQGTSVSSLVARTIERLVGEDQAYEIAKRRALEFMEQGFRLGGRIRVSRDALHER